MCISSDAALFSLPKHTVQYNLIFSLLFCVQYFLPITLCIVSIIKGIHSGKKRVSLKGSFKGIVLKLQGSRDMGRFYSNPRRGMGLNPEFNDAQKNSQGIFRCYNIRRIRWLVYCAVATSSLLGSGSFSRNYVLENIIIFIIVYDINFRMVYTVQPPAPHPKCGAD